MEVFPSSKIEVRQISANPCGCTARILVVDDNEYNIIPLQLLLKNNFDMQIEKAEDGQIAVEKFSEALNKECKCNLRAYRLIVMDLGMPRMDGKEASKRILDLIRNEPDLTHIVVLTSYTNKKIV